MLSSFDRLFPDVPSVVDVSSLVDVLFSRVRNVARVRGDDIVTSGVCVVVTLSAGLKRNLLHS